MLRTRRQHTSAAVRHRTLRSVWHRGDAAHSQQAYNRRSCIELDETITVTACGSLSAGMVTKTSCFADRLDHLQCQGLAVETFLVQYVAVKAAMEPLTVCSCWSLYPWCLMSQVVSISVLHSWPLANLHQPTARKSWWVWVPSPPITTSNQSPRPPRSTLLKSHAGASAQLGLDQLSLDLLQRCRLACCVHTVACAMLSTAPSPQRTDSVKVEHHVARVQPLGPEELGNRHPCMQSALLTNVGWSLYVQMGMPTWCTTPQALAAFRQCLAHASAMCVNLPCIACRQMPTAPQMWVRLWYHLDATPPLIELP